MLDETSPPSSDWWSVKAGLLAGFVLMTGFSQYKGCERDATLRRIEQDGRRREGMQRELRAELERRLPAAERPAPRPGER